MSKSDVYRANATECQRMSELCRNPAEKQMWLEMAASWLRMIQQPSQSASDKFDDAEKDQGTHQKRSDAEH